TTANEWTFGDGADNATPNPEHTYSSNGSYVVSHTVSNSCFAETQIDTLHIESTGINKISQGSLLKIATQGNSISFISSGNDPLDQMDIYSIDGRNIGHYVFINNKVTVSLPPGVYIYRAFSSYGNPISGRFSSIR